MKICFIGNMDSCHMTKWADYFTHRRNNILTIHVDKWWKSFNEFSATKNYIHSFQPHILNAHYAGMPGLIGALINYHPFIVTVWGSDVLVNSKSWIKRPFIKWILKKADLITCDAEYVKEFMIHKLDIPWTKIHIIRHGVDLEKFRPCWQICNKPEDYSEYGKCPEPMVIALRPYDMKTLEKAKEIVRRQFPTCYFRIPSSFEYIDHRKVPAHLNYAWIYVDTSPIDAGLSSATAEAMACGLPVVITDIGENGKWVPPTLRFKPGDYQRLADIIIDLLRDEERRNFIGQENRKLIVNDNDYHQEMAKMETLYEEIVND